jgi:hypothetical protein
MVFNLASRRMELLTFSDENIDDYLGLTPELKWINDKDFCVLIVGLNLIHKFECIDG